MTPDDLAVDYRQAGFGRRLGFGASPALLLVDLVRAYVDRSSALYTHVDDAVSSARRLLNAARGARIPILFTRVVYHEGGTDGGLFYKKVRSLQLFDRGSPAGAFIDGFEPWANEIVVTKQYASAFFGTSLSATLSALRADSVIIAGLTTSGCVRATAVDAIQHGLIPVVVREAVGDRAASAHEASLFDLQSKYADVASERDVTDYLTNLQRPA